MYVSNPPPPTPHDTKGETEKRKEKPARALRMVSGRSMVQEGVKFRPFFAVAAAAAAAVAGCTALWREGRVEHIATL